MSLYIKGIGLPPSGEAYVIYPDGSLNRQVCGICQCGLDGTAIELPPHGRLGDLDALIARNAYFADRDFVNPMYDDTLRDLVDAAPTIIPADGGADNG